MSSRFIDGVSWPGTYVLLSLFALGLPDAVSRPPVITEGSRPTEVSSYWMEDPDRDLGILEVYEHDLRYESVPDDLDAIVQLWLQGSITAGARVAWFGFEGSFDFDALLIRDIAPTIYAVADRTGVSTAFDDKYRRSIEWAARVESCRSQIVP
ncbi:hypothetical protein OG474_11385 [Kribbella sp. NBC_01505]|uniref:hypothetical protein n=1 Tax=Kribbella sp. NBC_01505 TaxID=2903580 RepID=UPI00386AFCE4